MQHRLGSFSVVVSGPAAGRNAHRRRSEGARVFAGSTPFDLELREGAVRPRMGAYVVSGGLASLGGIILAARIGEGDVGSGSPYPLDAVAAAPVGDAVLAVKPAEHPRHYDRSGLPRHHAQTA
jgi:hypothetical protein